MGRNVCMGLKEIRQLSYPSEQLQHVSENTFKTNSHSRSFLKMFLILLHQSKVVSCFSTPPPPDEEIRSYTCNIKRVITCIVEMLM